MREKSMSCHATFVKLERNGAVPRYVRKSKKSNATQNFGDFLEATCEQENKSGSDGEKFATVGRG
jgi:hypothetical protein